MYGFNIILQDGFDNVVKRVIEALKTEGFCVLTDIDVQATMKAKLNVDGAPYRILGACSPPLAHKAITADPDIGLLLPCIDADLPWFAPNFVPDEIVWWCASSRTRKSTWGFMDPIAVLKLTDTPAVTELAKEVRGRFERVRDKLAGS